MLDKLQVERERGITVKAQTASLFYTYQDETYLLNLIDTPVRLVETETVGTFLFCADSVMTFTPLFLFTVFFVKGHVDFSYEVSRSISACQGVLLVVDANQVNYKHRLPIMGVCAQLYFFN